MMKLADILLVLVVAVNTGCLATVLYPYGTASGDSILYSNDDGWLPMNICPFPFFGTTYGSLYLDNNGAVSFNGPIGQYVPASNNGCLSPSSSVPFPIIAPFWADVDTRYSGTVYYRVTQDAAFMSSVTADLKTYFDKSTIRCFTNPRCALVATWDNVVAFPGRAPPTSTFQLVLITDGIISYAIFNYDSIGWLLGTASGGSYPQAGYNDLAGNSNCVPMTGTASMTTLPTSSNVNVTGRYAYRLTTTEQCKPKMCGMNCTNKEWTQLNADTQYGWNVKLIGPPPTEASLALKRSGDKIFMGDSNALVLTYSSYICVRLVRFDVSCVLNAEVRLMDVDNGKEVTFSTGTLGGTSSAWNQYEKAMGPFCANRIKIRVWALNSTSCAPQPMTAIRHVGVEICDDGCFL